MPTPTEALLQAMRRLAPAVRQNRLMRIGDREIAMVMAHMGEADRAFLLSCVGPQKGRRIHDEMKLQARLAVRHEDYLAAIAHVRRCLATTTTRARLGSYIRPRGRMGPT